MIARGFTLLELLIGLAIGSLALVAAAQLATIGVQASGRGEQNTELAGRIRLMGAQLRADLGHVGYGSSGTIAVDPTAWGGPLAPMTFATAVGRTAIATVRGENAAAGLTIGGVAVQPGSDLITLVVADPDPTRIQRLPFVIELGTVALPLAAFPGGDGCQLLYVVDHAAPNGVGRTQILRFTPGVSPVPLLDALQFPFPQGTEVHCARISTYWVDNNAQLRRSDLDPAAPVAIAGTSIVTSPDAVNDVVSPGVVDLQLAYTFSKMAPGTTAASRTFGVPGGYVPAAATAWAEIRSVRYTIVGRSLRQVVNPGPPIDVPLYEDRAAGSLQLPSTYATHIIAGGAELTNLRYFDEQTEANVQAEPF